MDRNPYREPFRKNAESYISVSPNGAEPAVISLPNNGDIIYDSGVTLFQIQPANSSHEVPSTASGWSGTYIADQLDVPVNLTVSVNPNGASPVQILLLPQSPIIFNSGVTLFDIRKG
jgi:hypothetical protein